MTNLFRIDNGLYRSAEPQNAILDGKYLKEPLYIEGAQVETIVNLRQVGEEKEDYDSYIVGATIKKIPLYGLEFADALKNKRTSIALDGKVNSFLKIVTQSKNKPVLIHCAEGSDRTGIMTAIYRIAHQKWPVKEAIKEMQNSKFNYQNTKKKNAMHIGMENWINAWALRKISNGGNGVKP